jgi:hypothetical protein
MTAITATARFDMGRVISRTFGAIGKNLPSFGALTLLLYAVPQFAIQLGIARALQTDGAAAYGLFGLAGLCSMILGLVLQAGLVHGTVVSLAGRPASIGDGLRTGLRAFLPLLVMSILMILGEWIGTIALFVPGVMLLIRWSVAVPALVGERRGIFGSMKRSAELTRGHRWSIFGLLVVVLILMWIIGAASAALTASLNGAAGVAAANAGPGLSKFMATAPHTPLAIGVQVLLGSVLAMLSAAGAASLYSELRGLKDGVSHTDLAAVFD